MYPKLTRVALVLTLTAGLIACYQVAAPNEQPPGAEPRTEDIILATTTSTQDSGLLDELVPDFESKSGYRIQTVAVGTGKALAMGDEGNADVLLVHAPTAEKAIMDSGSGKERLLVMHNDFVIIGPSDDLANIRGQAIAADALERIAATQSTFTSRGDDSGTHKKELHLWDATGRTPEGNWYLESGQGMGTTLRIANEKYAYTLTDRATYLANKHQLDLEILVEGDPTLLNIYHVITIDPEKWPRVNYNGAIAFAKYLTSPEVQELIAKFGVQEFGQPLFFPDAGKQEADLGL